jgi:hypothetical protein
VAANLESCPDGWESIVYVQRLVHFRDRHGARRDAACPSSNSATIQPLSCIKYLGDRLFKAGYDMKCFSHVSRDATALCQGCQKGLCATCSIRFDTTLCEQCLLNHNKAVADDTYTDLLMTVILFLGLTWFFHKPQATHLPLVNSAMLGIIFSFTYYGWKFLTNLFPTVWIGSGIVWMVVTIVKLFAAYVIGLIVGPIQIFRAFKTIHITSRLRRQIVSGQL